MYYHEYSRINRMQKLLDRVAYISVGSDLLIAASTYLVITNVGFSNSALLLSSYLNFVLVAIAATMFLVLIAMKAQNRVVKKARLFAFKLVHQ